MMIQNNVDVVGNINISKSIFIKENITTHNLLLKVKSQFLGNMTMNNNIDGEFYVLDKYNKTFNVDGNGIYGNMMIQNNVDVTGNINISKSIFVKENITSDKLLVKNESQFLGVMTINNNVIGEFYTFDKTSKEISIDGKTIVNNIEPKTHNTYDLGSESKKFKRLYLSGNSLFLGNIHLQQKDGAFNVENIKVDKETETESLSVKGESYFENKMTINNNILGKFYEFNNNTSKVDITGDLISKTLTVKENSLFNRNIEIKGNGVFDKNIVVKENLSIYGNLIVLGNTTYVNSSQLEINDPVITIGNNISQSLKKDSGILIKTYDEEDNKLYYSGLIKKKGSNGIYLVKKIDVANSQIESVPITEKETLLVNNITTSSISEFTGGLFKDNILIPESATGKVEIYKDVNIEKGLTVLNDSSIKRDLIVDNNSFLKENLNVYGNVDISNNLDVSSFVVMKENVDILGNINIKNKLDVLGLGEFKEDLNIYGNVDIYRKFKCI